MKTANSLFRTSFRAGLIFTIIVIFLILIGFPGAAATLLARMIGQSPDPGQLPAVEYLGLFWVLLGIWNGASAASHGRKQSTNGAWKAALTALSSTGILTALFMLILGLLYQNGMDMRNYLSALSPEAVKYFEFNQSPLTGSLYYVGIFLASGLVGLLVNKAFVSGGGLRKIWSAVGQSVGFQFLRTNKWVRYGIFAVLALFCLILPAEWGSYWNYVFSIVGIYVVLGLGLNIIVGLSGQLVLGYVGFFAIGAYTMALLNAPKPHNLMWGFWLALPLAILMAAAAGVLIGLPIMRLRGDYLAIVTLGFGEIIRILLRSDLLTDFTGGPRGIQDIKGPVIFGKPFNSDVDFMYLIILAVLLAVFVASRLQNSRVGRSWLSIREDETVARASGVNTVVYKLLALGIGAALAGLGGAIFAAKTQFTGPGDHDLMVSINVLAIVIVGGLGSIPGILLGAFALKGLPEILREIANYRLLAFGMLLVLMMILRPQGLIPVARKELEQKALMLKSRWSGSTGGETVQADTLEKKNE